MHLRKLLLVILLACLLSACSLNTLLNPTVPQRVEPTPGLPADPDLSVNPTPNVPEPVDQASESGTSTDQTIAGKLVTPRADTPAAGICGEMVGQWITMTINPDMPDPRCVVIRPEQMLEVVNHRGETITVSIGNLTAELADGESYRFEVPFGEYLMPGGVHDVSVQPCCGGTLWFKDEP